MYMYLTQQCTPLLQLAVSSTYLHICTGHKGVTKFQGPKVLFFILKYGPPHEFRDPLSYLEMYMYVHAHA